MTQKEFKAREFAKCIEKDDITVTVNIDDILVESSYTGPKLDSVDDLNEEWVKELLQY